MAERFELLGLFLEDSAQEGELGVLSGVQMDYEADNVENQLLGIFFTLHELEGDTTCLEVTGLLEPWCVRTAFLLHGYLTELLEHVSKWLLGYPSEPFREFTHGELELVGHPVQSD